MDVAAALNDMQPNYSPLFGELPGTSLRHHTAVKNSESNEVFSETRYGLDGVVHKENSKKTIARRTGRSSKERGSGHTGRGFEKD
jgi:hypothetical protein